MEDTLHLPSGRRRARRGPMRGRLYLVLIFLSLFAFNLVNFLFTPSYEKQDFLLHEVPVGIVITSLLAGIWFRQFWARYLLVAIMLIRVVASCIVLPRYMELILSSWIFALGMLSGPILYALITWGLFSLPSIRRLVSRRYE
ncbi:MAG: hypothetical protein ABJF10_29320 [Chthoniobacter sp.]|uniref:hypothetical protein n=1 Tax=Chthoniobacter sp. TaxID=2510640 RepID=UPI0032AD86DB